MYDYSTSSESKFELTTSDEGLEDEELKSPAPTRCAKFMKAVWSYMVVACSLWSDDLVSLSDY